MSTVSKPLSEQDQSFLEEIKAVVSAVIFQRLDEQFAVAIRRKQERPERLQREDKLLHELRRLDLLEKYGPPAETLSDDQLELLELEPRVSTSKVVTRGNAADFSG